jgi:hypothetical protein
MPNGAVQSSAMTKAAVPSRDVSEVERNSAADKLNDSATRRHRRRRRRQETDSLTDRKASPQHASCRCDCRLRLAACKNPVCKSFVDSALVASPKKFGGSGNEDMSTAAPPNVGRRRRCRREEHVADDSEGKTEKNGGKRRASPIRYEYHRDGESRGIDCGSRAN